MSFTFLPRSIGKQKKVSQTERGLTGTVNRLASENGAGPSVTSSDVGAPSSSAVTSESAQISSPKDEELLVTLVLSLSDYALWCAPELQRRMKSGRDGYIPMKYIFENSPLFASHETPISEVSLMKCLRSSSLLEARMLIAEPSRNEWFNRGHGPQSAGKSHSGGFEVRRKDWDVVLSTIEKGTWNRDWWHQRTAYIERIPAAYRSIPSVSRYVDSLLSRGDEAVPSPSSRSLVQSVTFPAHHLAAPTEPSRCKGFAFAVLDSPDLVEKLSLDYPWEGTSSRPDLDQDAVKFGLRTLRHAAWDVLKVEYLSYQKDLLSQAAEDAADLEPPAEQIQRATRPLRVPKSRPQPPLQPPKMENASTWYPQNCLVFVKNVHPETNKTTLRSLFQSVLDTSEGGVDYVDFNKGLDSCHLRLASPSEATQLTSHFESHSIAQCNPLDQAGSEPIEGRPRIKLEVLQGKREELYWEKVPEKLRKAALERLARRKGGEIKEGEQQGGKRKKRKNM